MIEIFLACLAALAALPSSTAINNGLGRRPPMGWRSWNQFQCAINQSLVEEHYKILATYKPSGASKTLLEMGFKTAGIGE